MRHSDAGHGNAHNFTFLKSRRYAIPGLCNVFSVNVWFWVMTCCMLTGTIPSKIKFKLMLGMCFVCRLLLALCVCLLVFYKHDDGFASPEL